MNKHHQDGGEGEGRGGISNAQGSGLCNLIKTAPVGFTIQRTECKTRQISSYLGVISREGIRKLYRGLDYKRLRNTASSPGKKKKKPDGRINYVGSLSPSPRFVLSP